MARRILFVSESAEASPTRYRAFAYFDALRASGWTPRHVAVTGLWRRGAMLVAAQRADVIVVLRKQFTPSLCRLLRGKSRRLVLDIDDALFVAPDGTRPTALARNFAAMAAHVDVVWAGNSYLADEAAQSGVAVKILPTSVDTSLYTPASSRPESPFDVVWIGSSSTRKYLEGLLPVLGECAKQIPGMRLKIIADFDLPKAAALGVKTLPIRWSSQTEAAELASAHVGIAPLPDDPWTRGKCGLKILQYMAAGLPVIASRVGVQAELLGDVASGFLASSPEEWIAKMTQLRNNPDLRSSMGTAGRRRVCEHYSVAVTAKAMVKSLENLMEYPKKPRH